MGGGGGGPPVATRAAWARLLLGTGFAYAAFHVSATLLRSDRGERGLEVCALVLVALVAVERGLHGTPMREMGTALGLGRPRPFGVLVAAILAALLVGGGWVAAVALDVTWTTRPGWGSTVPGLFAQAGIAEEALFRAYLFGRLRRGRSFRRAALLSLLPFVGVHLVLFFTMPWTVATAAVVLSAVLAVPFARLFELGGSSVWAPALLHAVIQGTVKVVEVPGVAGMRFPLCWMAACIALAPWILKLRAPASPSGGGAGPTRRTP